MSQKLEKSGVPGIYRSGNRWVVRFTDADGRRRQRTVDGADEARLIRERGRQQPRARPPQPTEPDSDEQRLEEIDRIAEEAFRGRGSN